MFPSRYLNPIQQSSSNQVVGLANKKRNEAVPLRDADSDSIPCTRQKKRRRFENTEKSDSGVQVAAPRHSQAASVQQV